MFTAAFTILRKTNSYPKCFSLWNSGFSNSCLWKFGICTVVMYVGQLEPLWKVENWLKWDAERQIENAKFLILLTMGKNYQESHALELFYGPGTCLTQSTCGTILVLSKIHSLHATPCITSLKMATWKIVKIWIYFVEDVRDKHMSGGWNIDKSKAYSDVKVAVNVVNLNFCCCWGYCWQTYEWWLELTSERVFWCNSSSSCSWGWWLSILF